jgi:hypothetical protein
MTNGNPRSLAAGLKEQLPLWCSGLVILLFILLFAGSAAKPLQLDNMEFPAMAKATAASGLPVYYKGEMEPRALGLYHPPLYIYLLAGWFRAFGYGEAQARLFGMVCTLIQGGVVLLMIRTLFGTSFRWGPVFWGLFLLNPYTLQTAAVADIDPTIYGPLLCLVVLTTLRVSWRDGEWRTDAVTRLDYFWIGLALLLCLWSKLTTVLLVVPAVFLLLIARLGVRKAAAATALLAAASTAVFVATYYLYGAVTGLDINFTYRFTLFSFLERGSRGGTGLLGGLHDRVGNLAGTLSAVVAWTGGLPWLSGAAAVLIGLHAGLRKGDRRLLHYAIALGLGLLTTLYYCFQTGPYSLAPFKYTFVYWGLCLTAPLVLLSRHLQPDLTAIGGWAKGIGLVGFFLAVAVWANFKVRDDVMMAGNFIGHRWVALLPGVLFLGALAFAWLRKRGFGVPMLALALYAGLQFGSAVYQERAPYSTTYDYGQMGFADTVAFLKSSTGPDDVIAAGKDVGLSSGIRCYENSKILGPGPDSPDEADYQKRMLAGRFAFMVFSEVRGTDHLENKPGFARWFLEHATLVRSIGHYRIYKVKPEFVQPPAAAGPPDERPAGGI